MLCRHCGRKISLLRRLSDAEFCSDSHRANFIELEREAALARLTESGARIIPLEPAPPRKGSKKQVRAKDEIPAPLAGILREPERKPKTKRQVCGQPRMMGWTLVQELPQLTLGVQARRMDFAGGVPLDAHPARPAALTQVAQVQPAEHGERPPEAWQPPMAGLSGLSAAPPLRGSMVWRVGLAAWTGPKPGSSVTSSTARLHVVLGSAARTLSPAVDLANPLPIRATTASAGPRAEPGLARHQTAAGVWPAMPSGGGSGLAAGVGASLAEAPASGPDVLAGIDLAPLAPVQAYACQAQRRLPRCSIRALGPRRRLAGPRIRRETVLAAGLAPAGQALLPSPPPCNSGPPQPRLPAAYLHSSAAGPDLQTWPRPFGNSAWAAGLQSAGLQGLGAGRPVDSSTAPVQSGAPVGWPGPDPAAPRSGLAIEGELTAPVTAVRTVVFKQSAATAVAALGVEQGGESPSTPGTEAESSAVAAAAQCAPGGPPLLDRQFPLFASRGLKAGGQAAWLEPAGRSGLWEGQLARPPMIRPLRLIPDHADGSGSRVTEIRPADPSKPWLSIHLPSLPVASWRAAPADLKWITLALPAILLLALYSFLPSRTKNSVETASTGISQPTALSQRFETIRTAIMQRAAVKMADDFRAGLGAWQGTSGWAQSWTYTDASFVSPGQLALYKPSLEMRDYVFAFLGQIDRRSLNWVVRARDENNYIAMRIVMTKGGPVPAASLIRYAVIGGKPDRQTTLPLPVAFRDGTMQQIEVTVAGDTITTRMMGQVVDSFSEDRLTGGGVGFYSPKGDRSLLRWISITHQYDYIGRLCALLAPYHVSQEARRME